MNSYKQVIDVITDKNIDLNTLCIEIAKHNPHAVISAAKRIGVVLKAPEPAWMIEVRQNAKNKKIHAIKLYREHVNCSVMDANNFVESL